MFGTIPKTLAISLLILASSVPVAEASSPTVVDGVLQDEEGNAASGSVVLYHFDVGKLSLTSSQKTDSGAFSLRSGPTAAMKQAASGNNGYVHFMLAGLTDSGYKAEFFSRQISGSTWSRMKPQLQLRATNMLTAEQQSEAQQINGGGENGQVVLSSTDCLPSYNLNAVVNRYTMVGELHTASGMTGTFVYGHGNTADSEISVKLSADGDNWQAGGSIHVGTQGVARVSRTKNIPYGYGVKTNFTYGLFQKQMLPGPFCLFAPNYLTLPLAWNSGLITGWDLRYLDNKCHTDFRRWSVWFESGDTFSRENVNLTWFDGGIKVFGAGIETKSGASQQVKFEYAFGNKHPRYRLCGNNAFPPAALRIFAGP